MLTKHLSIWVCIICIIIAFHGTASHAQSTFHAPLLINISGQVYRWLPGEEAPTPAGCDLQGNALHMRFHSLTQSADGIWASFMVLPADMEDGAPTPTGNLWVCNLELGAAFSLSNANPNSPGLVSNGVFSPDSSKIAWTEVNDPPSGSDARILVHDLAAQETSVLVENTPLDEPCGVGTGAPRLVWGEAGIAVGFFAASDANCGIAEESGVLVYSEHGDLQAQFPFEHLGLDLMEWVEIDGEPHLALRDIYSRPQLFTINLQDGKVTEQASVLDTYRPDAATDAGHYFGSNFRYSSNPPLLYLPGSEEPLESPIDSALSPDGSLMVLVIGKTLYLGQNGNLEPAPWNTDYFQISDSNGGLDIPDLKTGQLEVAWTNPAYRLLPQNTANSVCPTVDQLYLSRGGRVIAGLGDNNIRSAPLTTAPIIGSIPEGDSFITVDVYNFSPFSAPPVEVCSNGIRWREVMYGNVIGWTAEAQDNTYFIEALQ